MLEMVDVVLISASITFIVTGIILHVIRARFEEEPSPDYVSLYGLKGLIEEGHRRVKK